MTTLRDNASAYGYSVTITGAFGLVTTVHGAVHTPETILFVVGAAVSFVLVEALVTSQLRIDEAPEASDVILVSSVVNVVSITCAVGTAALLAIVPGLAAWPLVAIGATTVYLLVSGLDVLIARAVVRRTGRFARGR